MNLRLEKGGGLDGVDFEAQLEPRALAKGMLWFQRTLATEKTVLSSIPPVLKFHPSIRLSVSGYSDIKFTTAQNPVNLSLCGTIQRRRVR